MQSKNHKQVKLQPKHRYLTYGHKTVPELKLSGVWLEQLGFNPGESVRVTTREKLLIIEPLESHGDTRD